MRKTLVIGGNRYFGKRLVDRLIANGDDVTVLNRGKFPNPFSSNVKHLIADRTNELQLKNAVAGQTWDLIYDQCCYSATEAKFASEAFEGKTSRYIFTSTQSTYLDQKGVLTETDFDPFTAPYHLGFMSDFTYGDAKRYAESYFFQHAKFPVVAMRIPIVLGPDDYTGRLEFHIDRVKSDRPIVHEN
jgi:nucleoside-diphosphate-sugar epimerase